ncbi:MAG: DNA cytosine methyltransferase [Bacteroidales bacterium]|jgi:DNA (cytosine-5)-methyltransferase 1
MKPRLLDLFCGAGGAGMGYSRAGFEVVGVDNKPQKRYPFEFHQADALEYLQDHWQEFDVIHASPPCQKYSKLKGLTKKNYPKLIIPLRKKLIYLEKPYIIENVPGAELINPILLCGTMFGLKLIRHRIFETTPPIFFLQNTHKCRKIYTAGFHGRSSFSNGAQAICVAGNGYNLADGKTAMGIDWMTKKELSQAIPPAYTEWIGKQILERINVR